METNLRNKVFETNKTIFIDMLYMSSMAPSLTNQSHCKKNQRCRKKNKKKVHKQ